MNGWLGCLLPALLVGAKGVAINQIDSGEPDKLPKDTHPSLIRRDITGLADAHDGGHSVTLDAFAERKNSSGLIETLDDAKMQAFEPKASGSRTKRSSPKRKIKSAARRALFLKSKLRWKPICKDNGNYCKNFTKMGWCDTYEKMMFNNCKKSCEMCNTWQAGDRVMTLHKLEDRFGQIVKGGELGKVQGLVEHASERVYGTVRVDWDNGVQMVVKSTEITRMGAPPKTCPRDCNGCFAHNVCIQDQRDDETVDDTKHRCTNGNGLWCESEECPADCSGCFLKGSCRQDVKYGELGADTKKRCQKGGGRWCRRTKVLTAKQGTTDPTTCDACDACLVKGQCRRDAQKGASIEDTQKKCEVGGGKWCAKATKGVNGVVETATN